jgi:hypothetical protein
MLAVASSTCQESMEMSLTFQDYRYAPILLQFHIIVLTGINVIVCTGSH